MVDINLSEGGEIRHVTLVVTKKFFLRVGGKSVEDIVDSVNEAIDDGHFDDGTFAPDASRVEATYTLEDDDEQPEKTAEETEDGTSWNFAVHSHGETFKQGEKVFWTDPDDGILSGVYTIARIRNASSGELLLSDGDTTFGAFAQECTHL